MSPHVINFWALLPHMYGDINKLSQCFVELVFFYFLFAHNIYSKLQHCFSIFEPLQCRALQDISQFSQCKPKCLNTAQVACPQHWSRMSGRRAQYIGGLCIYSINLGCLSYKSYSTVSTGQRRSHCPETNFSHYSASLQGAAPTGQLPCRQSIPNEYSSFIK